jgi:hypothetical protein
MPVGVLAVGLALFVSQVAFYLAAYLFLGTHLGIYRYMLLTAPLLFIGAFGPFWALRFAQSHGWSLWPVQLAQFGFAVLAAAAGLMLLRGQMPDWRIGAGLLLVVAGVTLSALPR